MPVSGLNVAPRTENAGAEVPEGNVCVSHIFQKWFQQMPTQDRGGKYMAKKKSLCVVPGRNLWVLPGPSFKVG